MEILEKILDDFQPMLMNINDMSEENRVLLKQAIMKAKTSDEQLKIILDHVEKLFEEI